jgi:pyrroline-5-carboxylate reductase
MSSTKNYSLCVLGCGTLGSSILSGILADQAQDNILPSTSITLPIHACVQQEESGRKLQKTFGNQVKVYVSDNVSAVQVADVIILGYVPSCQNLTVHKNLMQVRTKPQAAADVMNADGMADALKSKVVISMCAGVRLAQLKQWAPDAHVVRTMPNTPCQVTLKEYFELCFFERLS